MSKYFSGKFYATDNYSIQRVLCHTFPFLSPSTEYLLKLPKIKFLLSRMGNVFLKNLIRLKVSISKILITKNTIKNHLISVDLLFL